MTCPVLTYRHPSADEEITCLPDERAIWLWGEIAPPDSRNEWLIFVIPTALWISAVLLSTVLLALSRTSSIFSPFSPSLLRLVAKSPCIAALDLVKSHQDLLSARGGDPRLGCLDYFRVAAMLWVFANHLGSEGRIDILERLSTAQPFKDAIHTNLGLGPFLGNSALGVEIFLVLSAILIAKMLKEAGDAFSRQWIRYLVRRALRLWLCILAFLTVAFSPLLRRLLPRFYGTMCTACGWKGVFSHLTFRSNTQDQPTCLGYLWYLGLDIQLHAVTVFPLLALLSKWRRLGILTVASLVIASIVLRALHCSHYGTCNKSDVDIPFIHIGSLSAEEIKEVYRGLWTMYSSILTKGGPFVMSVVVGVWIAEGKVITERLARKLFWGGFIGCVVIIWSILPEYWYPDMETNAYNLIYSATFRTFFAAAILSMISSMAMIQNPAPVPKMISVLAKMCFSAYLLHMPLVYVFNYVPWYQVTTDPLDLLKCLCAHAPLTFTCAYFFHLLVEAPVGRISPIILKNSLPLFYNIVDPIAVLCHSLVTPFVPLLDNFEIGLKNIKQE